MSLKINGIEPEKILFQKNNSTVDLNAVRISKNGIETLVWTKSLSLVPPQISGTFKFDSYGNFYFLDTNITNANSVSVTAKIAVYSNGNVLEFEGTHSISANSTFHYGAGEMYSTGAYMIVVFERSGYESSRASTTFGNYTGTTVDESTTTTT